MSLIKFFSTNGHREKVDFKRALLAGQAPDKGLYSFPLSRSNP